MEKLYDRINWHNDTDPAINESNLNRMDSAIDAIDTRVVNLSGLLVETVPEIREYLEESEELVERIETMTKNPPYIGANGNWYVFNTNTMQYEDSGIDASITVQIADITMLPYIDAPYVTNSGTNTDPVFHLFIPRAATISSVEKTQIVGNVDTYTMTLQDGSTFNFTVTNGTGSGDMKAVDYDPQGIVSTEGGIIDYGEMRLRLGLIEGTGHTHGTQSASRFMHIEGVGNNINSNAKNIHAEGVGNTVGACDSAHAEGQNNQVSGSYGHVEGFYNDSSAEAAHAEGVGCCASGSYSHTEGEATLASGEGSHAEGNNTRSKGEGSHAEGIRTNSTNAAAHSEGFYTSATGAYSHAEGNYTQASAQGSHAEGFYSAAGGKYSHAEGDTTCSMGEASHSEGGNTVCTEQYSHAEGLATSARGYASHTEGAGTYASGSSSHAEGTECQAIGHSAHAEGVACSAYAMAAHAGGNGSEALSTYSFVHGDHCIAEYSNSMAIGESGHTYSDSSNITKPRLFAVGSPKRGRDGLYNELEADITDYKSDIIMGRNIFSVDNLGNTFMRGAPFTAKGVIYNRLIANGDYFVLEDGAAYVLWTNTRMINNNAWRGAQAYYIVSPFAPSAYGTGASTTALAVAQHHQFSSIGTAGLTLKKDTVPYLHPGTGTTCYHARIGIGSCVANCCVRYTLIKILGSELDMLSNDT
ncbi:MAG: hypothetical protein IIZ78_04980 [Clostridiales bacterium]|nr:hypothetical protein [Clostridiales bacterium]